ncbi:MAG: transposase [Methanobrevibacter sp.]|nr:transposase [Candidatus Methanovirga australis]
MVFSVRRLAKAVKRDVAYMYLSGCQMPDHSTYQSI